MHRHRRPIRSCLLAIVGLVTVALLSGCRVDATIDVVMIEDGSGTITVTLEADADVVRQATGLAEDLRFDDLTAVGWVVGEPTPTADDGLSVVLAHDFAAPEELTALLASLNGADGPFKSVAFRRETIRSRLTFTMTGTGRVDAGIASFADADLIAAIGATPYADEIASAGLSQSDAVVITLRVDLPGEIDHTTGTEEDGTIRWVIPLDSRPVELETVTSATLERGGGWKIASTTLQALFVAWVVIAGVVIVYLVVARRGGGGGPRRRTTATRGGRTAASTGMGVHGPAGPRGSDGWDHAQEGDGWDDPRNPPDPDGPDRGRPVFPRPNR